VLIFVENEKSVPPGFSPILAWKERLNIFLFKETLQDY